MVGTDDLGDRKRRSGDSRGKLKASLTVIVNDKVPITVVQERNPVYTGLITYEQISKKSAGFFYPLEGTKVQISLASSTYDERAKTIIVPSRTERSQQ